MESAPCVASERDRDTHQIRIFHSLVVNLMKSHLLFLLVAGVLLQVGVAFRALRSSLTPQRAKHSILFDGASEGSWLGAKKISQGSSGLATILSSEQISKILPHRYPFLLVDRVVEFEPGKRAVGLKCVTANEPQFTGHFPDRPVMPGVLMLEAMAQLGGIIALSPPVSPAQEEGAAPKQRLFFFTGVTGVRWKSPVTPGDVLVMEMTLKSFDDRLGFASMTGKAYVGGKVAVTVDEFTFALVQ